MPVRPTMVPTKKPVARIDSQLLPNSSMVRPVNGSAPLAAVAGQLYFVDRLTPQHDQTGVAQGGEHVAQRILDASARGVAPHRRVVRLLVRRGDAGELRDLAPASLGVQALLVATLTLLERRRDVDQKEGAAGILDVRPHLAAGL